MPIDWYEVMEHVRHEARELAAAVGWRLPPAVELQDLEASGLAVAAQRASSWTEADGPFWPAVRRRVRWAMVDLLRRADMRPRGRSGLRFVPLEAATDIGADGLPDRVALADLVERALDGIRPEDAALARLVIMWGWRPRELAWLLGRDVRRLYGMRRRMLRALRRRMAELTEGGRDG